MWLMKMAQHAIPSYAKKFVTSQLQFILILILVYVFLQKIFSMLILNSICMIKKVRLSQCSIGFIFLNCLNRTYIKLHNATEFSFMKIRVNRKKLDDANGKTLVLDFLDCNFTISDQMWNELHQKKDKSQKNESQNSPIVLEIPLKTVVKWKRTIQFLATCFFPLQISLQKIYIKVNNEQFYLDYANLKLQYDTEHQTITFNVFLHDFVNYKDTHLKHLEFNIVTGYDIFENNTLRFKKWSTSLRLSDFKTSVTHKNDTSKPTSSKRNIILKDLIKKYQPLLKTLNVVDFKLENITITTTYHNMKFHCSNLLFSIKRLTHVLEEYKFEVTISSNSIHVDILNQRVFSVPLVNIFSTSDHLLTSDQKTINYTMTIVDSTIAISYDHIEYFLQHFKKRTKSSSGEKSHFFAGIPIPKFNIKVLLPNLSFKYLAHDKNDFVWKNNEISMHLQHSYKTSTVQTVDSSGSSLVRLNQPIMEQVSSSNYIKISGSSLTFKSKHLELPMYAIHKIEAHSNNDSPYVLNFIVKGLHFTLNHLKILESLNENIGRFQSLKNEYITSKTTVKESSSNELLQLLEIKFQLLESSFVTCIGDSISKNLDPTQKLYQNSFGVLVHCDNTFIYFKQKSLKIDMENLTINKALSVNQFEAKQEFILRMQNVTFFKDPTGAKSLDIPQFKIIFDIPLIWIIFYLKTVYTNIFVTQSTKEKTKTTETPSFNVSVGVTLVEAQLADKLNLLFTCYKLNIIDGVVFFKKLHVLTRSVYVANPADDIYVRLFRIDDFKLTPSSKNTSGEVELQTKIIQLSTEYHLRFYTIVDRIVTTFKSYKQIKSAFRSLPAFHHLKSVSEDPKRVPKIRIKTRKLIVKVDEDPFEHELGLIFRVGVMEQRLRLQKLTHFEEQLSQDNPLSDDEVSRLKSKLYKNFSTSWIERIDKARQLFTNVGAFDLTEKHILGRNVKALFGHEKTPLFSLSLDNVDLLLQEPSFGVKNYPEFIWEYGKHIPLDTEYTLLIPMNMKLSTDILKIQLRDYMLPILSLPGLKMQGDFCFAEKLADYKSNRAVWVPFIDETPETSNSIFGSHIIRTLNPVKTFMNATFDMDSHSPSIITWGKSLQPGYQSIMLWFDYFTKPPLDPSPKIGFWDKFRLLIHGKMIWNWTERSELHLNIKGSWSPYKITDDGAGLTFCWNKGTQMVIHGDDNPKNLMVINSNGFLLGIRDFTTEARRERFSKVLMRLTGKVTWKMGFLFEGGDISKAGEEPRTTHFKNHYMIDLINPLYVEKGVQHDSYAGFRSDFIHMSIGVASDLKDVSKNTVHFAPFSTHHFRQWWKLFGTYTSGPIRQGPLFSSLAQSSKKFGASLFTIKYSLSLGPLDIAQAYKHFNISDNMKSTIEFTGLKGRVESLKIDLHQKRLKMIQKDDKLKRTKDVWKLKLDQGEIDCVMADIRLMSAKIDRTKRAKGCVGKLNGVFQTEHDIEWFNIRDFVDLGDVELLSNLPISYYTIPLMFSPRISYFRNVERKVHLIKYPFGNEDSHDCIHGKNDPEQTQKYLIQKRDTDLKKELSVLESQIQGMNNGSVRSKDLNLNLKKLENEKTSLHQCRSVLAEVFQDINGALNDIDLKNLPPVSSLEDLTAIRTMTVGSMRKLKKESCSSATNTFDNRFIFHNVQLRINEKTKNLLIEYTSKMAERRASAYYLLHKSLSIVNELLNSSETQNPETDSPKFERVAAEETISNNDFISRFEELIREVSEQYLETVDNMLLKFILPQIQITSTVEKQWAAMVTSREFEVGIIDVVQKDLNFPNLISSVESLKETRYCTLLTDANFFVFNKDAVLNTNLFNIGAAGYGCINNLKNWPPWIPVEGCYNPELLSEYSVLKKTDMFFTFTKPNSLFFNKYTHLVYEADPILKIGFPQLHLTSDVIQYNAIYNIIEDIMDLGSTLDKKLDRLTQNILADELKSNFKLSFTFILGLQNKIKELIYQSGVLKLNDPDTYKLLHQSIETELTSSIFELTLLMSALKKSFARMKGLKHSTKLLWFVSADEIIWEMYDEDKAPFITFGLGYSTFQRAEDTDGANTNRISINSLNCFNLQENPVYVDLLSPYENLKSKIPSSRGPLLEIMWFLGTPVGGIVDLEDLTIRCKPIKFQMDHLTLNKFLDYLFTSRDTGSSAASKGLSTRASLDNGHAGTPIGVKDSAGADTNAASKSAISLQTDLHITSDISNRFSSQKEGIEEMVTRSSKFFNIKSVTIEHMKVCVSYSGSKSVITNVNNLIVKVPTISYTNKIWSKDEFQGTLKKDIIKIVLQHTGTILGNKFKSKKKTESTYDSFKQFSKMLKNEVKTRDSVDSDVFVAREKRYPPQVTFSKAEDSDDNESSEIRAYDAA